MNWDKWGDKLRGAFGGAKANDAPQANTPKANTPQVNTSQVNTQTETPPGRSLSVREVDILLNIVQRLKDIAQTNQLAISTLMNATPRHFESEAACAAIAEMQDSIREKGKTTRADNQDILSNYVHLKVQLEQTRKHLLTIEAQKPVDEGQSLREIDRKLIVNIGESMAGSYHKTMVGLYKMTKTAHTLLVIDGLDRLMGEFRDHEKAMDQLTLDYFDLSMNGAFGKRNMAQPGTFIP